MATGRWDVDMPPNDAQYRDLMGVLSPVVEARINPHEISSQVRALGIDEDTHPEVVAIRAALDYMGPATRRKSRDIDEIFAPMIALRGGRIWPPRLSATPGDLLDAWVKAADMFPHAEVLSARLNDLLWCRRVGDRPDQRARIASGLYVGLLDADGVWAITRAERLSRACVLATEVNDEAVQRNAIEALVLFVRATLASNERIPGVTVPMIETLCAAPVSAQPHDLDQLISDARARPGRVCSSPGRSDRRVRRWVALFGPAKSVGQGAEKGFRAVEALGATRCVVGGGLGFSLLPLLGPEPCLVGRDGFQAGHSDGPARAIDAELHIVARLHVQRVPHLGGQGDLSLVANGHAGKRLSHSLTIALSEDRIKSSRAIINPVLCHWTVVI